MKQKSSHIVVGGARGIVKLLDGKTLDIITVAETGPHLNSLELGSGLGGRVVSAGNDRSMDGDWSTYPRGAGDILGLSVSKVTSKDARGGYVSVVAASAFGRALRVDLPVVAAPRMGVTGMDTYGSRQGSR